MSWNNGPCFRAGGTVPPGVVVKLDASNDNSVVKATGAAGEVIIGISKRSMRDAPGLTGSDTTVAANSGESIEVYGIGDVAPALAGAAVTRGQYLTVDSTSRVIAASTSTNQSIVGEALESASGAGVEIQIRVNPFRMGQL